MTHVRLKETLSSGGSSKDRGQPTADGTLTADHTSAEADESRSPQTAINTITSSSSYLDSDENASDTLYGKFIWKIEKFSDIAKRELRSPTFSVGPYRWYILIYPKGCDVSNHLSLFLCVADYDRLLPGWSHYAQFTIAVSNKDSKKSKYSDTLHRFCKKEHDWGWKKFMELNKIPEGFIDEDGSLIVKAQVQIIKDKPTQPICSLDAHYRRELLRVYLSNIEGIACRILDEGRAYLGGLLDEKNTFKSWFVEKSVSKTRNNSITSLDAGLVYKDLIKRLFDEKEVTSSLLMDALYYGAKWIESRERRLGDDSGSSGDSVDGDALLGLVLDGDKNVFHLEGDIIQNLVDCCGIALPTFSENGSSSGAAGLNKTNKLTDGSQREGSSKSDKNEKQLITVGRKILEMTAICLIARTKLEVSWQETETIKKQEALLAEMEEAGREEAERDAQKAEAERERRARKKDKQRRKKEAEKAKKDAEDAEKLRVEEEKKAEQDRKAKEAEEKRRKEESKDLERQQQQQELAKAKKIKAEQQKEQQKQQQSVSTPRAIVPSPNANGAKDYKQAAAPSPTTANTPVLSGEDKILAIDDEHVEGQHSANLLKERVAEVEMLKTQVVQLTKLLESKDTTIASLESRMGDLEQQLLALPRTDSTASSSRPGSSIQTTVDFSNNNNSSSSRRPDPRTNGHQYSNSLSTDSSNSSHTSNGSPTAINLTTTNGNGGATSPYVASLAGIKPPPPPPPPRAPSSAATTSPVLSRQLSSNDPSHTSPRQCDGYGVAPPPPPPPSYRNAALNHHHQQQHQHHHQQQLRHHHHQEGNGNDNDNGGSFSSPTPPPPLAARDPRMPMESTGLEEFAHMDLIKDLLFE